MYFKRPATLKPTTYLQLGNGSISLRLPALCQSDNIGILTMIDTPNFAIFNENKKKCLKMRKRLYIARDLSIGKYGILTIKYIPILAIFMGQKIFRFWPFFLKMWKRVYIDVETFPHFLEFAYFWKYETFPHFLILAIVWKWGDVSAFLDFACFLKIWKSLCRDVSTSLDLGHFPHFLILPVFFLFVFFFLKNVETSLYRDDRSRHSDRYWFLVTKVNQASISEPMAWDLVLHLFYICDIFHSKHTSVCFTV